MGKDPGVGEVVWRQYHCSGGTGMKKEGCEQYGGGLAGLSAGLVEIQKERAVGLENAWGDVDPVLETVAVHPPGDVTEIHSHYSRVLDQIYRHDWNDYLSKDGREYHRTRPLKRVVRYHQAERERGMRFTRHNRKIWRN